MVRRLALATLFAAAMVRSGHSQEVTGEVEGWVVREPGTPLANVEVSASGSSLQGVRSVLSDGRGYFRIPALPVGSYWIRFRLIGYRPATYENVRIRLATTTSLGRVHLEAQTVELPELIVSGVATPIDPTTAANRATLTSEQLAELPVDRNFRSSLALLPQANTSYYGDEVNIAGSTGLENIYYVDGINVTDPSNAATSTNLPYNFVQEIELSTAGYEAEYGRALGGIVNVVTPSGGNEFRGQVYTFFASDELQTSPRLGLGEGNPTSASSYDVGASLGGPIIRDRLWFFAAYNPTSDRRDVDVPGLSLRHASGTQHLLAGKLTWQAGPRTSLVFTVIGDPAEQEQIGPFVHLFGAPVTVANPEVVEGKLTQGGINLSLQARHQLSRRLLVHAAVSRFNRRDDNEPRTSFGLTEPLFIDETTGAWSGGYAGALRIRSERTAVGVSAALALAAHSVKLGFDYEDNFSDINNQRGAGGGGGGVISRLTNDAGYQWFEFYNRGQLHNRIPTVYGQDSWQLTQRLRLNAGLRWSVQRLVSPDSGFVTQITDGIQPRIGLVYQLGELGSQKVFGSYGRFSEQLPLWLAEYFGPGRFRFRTFPQDPRVDTTGAVGPDVDNNQIQELSSSRDVVGESFDEVSVGYERRLGQRIRFGVRGLYRWLRWGVDDGLNPTDSIIHFGNPGRGALSGTPKFDRSYTALEVTLDPFGNTAFPFHASYVLSRSYGNYTGLFSTDYLVPTPNIGPQGDLPEQMENGTGLLPNDRTHVFKFFGSHRFAYGFAAGVSLLWGSGTPLSEYGALGGPYRSFVTQRGTAGRTPALWDLNLRCAYELPLAWGRGRPRALVDLLHIGSPRRAVTLDEQHYLAVDADGNQTGVNPTYGQVTHYQPPMYARLGVTVDF